MNKLSTKEKVLLILESKKGEFISGEEIGTTLGVSRNAIWKAISGLKEKGYEIESSKIKGYCLRDKKNILSLSKIQSCLDQKMFYNIQIEEEVTSTNSILKEWAIEGEPEGKVLIANKQTNGRGRQNRSFYSPENTGIYMSILLRPKLDINQALMITTGAAVGICRAIEEVTGASPGIKWVNDIYIQEKKICGILTEAGINLESKSLDYAILGIGINIQLPEGDFPEEIKDIAGSLFGKNSPEDTKNQLIAEILNEFYEIYQNLLSKEFLEEYKSRSILINREVSLIKVGETRKVKVIDIDKECRLVVKSEAGIEYINSGEVSLKI